MRALFICVVQAFRVPSSVRCWLWLLIIIIRLSLYLRAGLTPRVVLVAGIPTHGVHAGMENLKTLEFPQIKHCFCCILAQFRVLICVYIVRDFSRLIFAPCFSPCAIFSADFDLFPSRLKWAWTVEWYLPESDNLRLRTKFHRTCPPNGLCVYICF